MSFLISLGVLYLQKIPPGGEAMERKPEKWIIKDERGRRPGQKYKSLLVMQYILKNADDENAVTMDEILNHLAK